MSIPFDAALSETAEVMSDDASSTNAADQPDNLNRNESTEALYREYAPNAIRYAMSIVRSWSDAEELVQEAFCRMIRASNTKTDQESRAMLFAIVRNLSLDLLRKNKRRRFEPVEANQIPSQRVKSDEHRLKKLETEIQVSLGKMPPQWADALQLKINGGLSYAEISNVLKATHSQIRTWIYRARKHLEQDLIQQGLLASGESNA